MWLGNVRGNRYSRQHLDHDPDGRRGNRRRFWDFSWHQVSRNSKFDVFSSLTEIYLKMGLTDLPAMIDYITSVTDEQRMHYVGHSQGTTSFFIMCSQRPHYSNRIISAHMLAPIAYMGKLIR